MIRLREVAPADADLLLRWENDPAVWAVSGTTEPFSRAQIEQFIRNQQAGIAACGQLRLMIECRAPGVGQGAATPRAIGAIDLFDYDPQNGTAGVGILIHDPADRRKGYATRALQKLETCARHTLALQELRCRIFPDNTPSLALFRRAGFQLFAEPAARPDALCFRKEL